MNIRYKLRFEQYFDGEAAGRKIFSRLQLNEAIAQLADGYRKVVILQDIQGFEREEIAQMRGCASGTSKSQLYKAQQVLRRLLTGGNASTLRTVKVIE